mmetsp:Transcript_17670/g.34224  ORF Transcript_17670/g.34224 Transcript_17670/m.34224 type:complete len:114 (+) Transcript_17670:1443-1784(+)
MFSGGMICSKDMLIVLICDFDSSTLEQMLCFSFCTLERIHACFQDNNEVHFKVKKTTKFEKIMEAFCKKKGVDKANTRFIFDGQRINGQQTPNDLDMEDDDTIEVMMEQVGGR